MVLHGRPSFSSAARPAFEEVPLQDIIECRSELDNLSKTQSGKLTYTHNRHGTWMHPSATIRLGSGGSQFMSSFVFQGCIGLNAEGNSMATFMCIVKQSRWYQMMIAVIEQRWPPIAVSSLSEAKTKKQHLKKREAKTKKQHLKNGHSGSKSQDIGIAKAAGVQC